MALSRVVSEIFNVEKCHDLEIGVRVHSWSLKVLPFGRSCVVSYECSLVTLSLKRTVFRSTSKSRPNNIGGKMSVRSIRPSVRPSTKSFFDLNEIWYIGRDRWVMHDGMPYGRIQGQGQGHEKFNQLELVTTFTFRFSLAKIDECHFELSW